MSPMDSSPPVEEAENLGELDGYTEKFVSSRSRLRGALAHRTKCFNKLTDCIGVCLHMIYRLRLECPCKSSENLDIESLKKMKEELQKQLSLSLIIFGRSNTGKSTLLNQLLCDWPDKPSTGIGSGLLPMSEKTCTARISVVAYGSSNTICLVDQQNPDKQLDVMSFEKHREVREFIDLKDEQRTKEEAINLLVRIQLPSELLRNNLHLVDSPGMGETTQMNEVVTRFLENCVHSAIIVYMLDGRAGYQPNPDCENIRFLDEKLCHMQKLIAVNRVDLDFENFERDVNDEDFDSDEELQAEYLKRRATHTEERMAATRAQMEKNHPGFIRSDGAEDAADQSKVRLVGVSAKSVKQFIADDWKFPYSPYLDSFLQFESEIASLVYANGRHHLQEKVKYLRQLLGDAKNIVIANKVSYDARRAKTKKPIEQLDRVIPMIETFFSKACDSLLSMASEDILINIENRDNLLCQLKERFVKDGEKSEIAMDPNLAMRKDEATLINLLLKAHGNSKESIAGIRLLCNFKDAVVSILSTSIKSGYRGAFVKAMMHMTYGGVIEEACGELEFRDLMTQLKFAISSFELNEDAFKVFVGSRLAESMRTALPPLVRRPEFYIIVSSKSQNWRANLLDYFLRSAELSEQVASAISGYCEQLREKKESVQQRFRSVLDSLRQVQGAGSEEILTQLMMELVSMTFYLRGLQNEVELMVDFDVDPSHQIFQYQKLDVSSAIQMGQRQQADLEPRTGGQSLRWLHRFLQVERGSFHHLASSVMQLSDQIPSPLRVHWFCLAEDYGSFVQRGASSPVLLVLEGIRCSLADLQPHSISEQVRLAWLHGLLKCFSGMLAAKYRPLDYRPSNIMISIGQPKPRNPLAASCPPDELKGTAAVADPTYLLADASSGQPADSASLAACIATLFGYSEATPGRASWDEHYHARLQDAASSPAEFLKFLPSCLGARPDPVISVVCSSVRACMAKNQVLVNDQVNALMELIEK